MLRVVAIADSDSYLKWSAATLAAMPADWQTEQWVIRSPIAPSPAQVAAATPERVPIRGLAETMIGLARHPPDVLLLAATGPVVHAMLGYPLLRRSKRRPVLITGLPGISIPASELALRYRRGCDLFLLHSMQEIEQFGAAADRAGVPIGFGLASLPFIREVRQESGITGSTASGHHGGRSEEAHRPKTIVFAAQAKVPSDRSDREQILRSLAALAPRRRVVIKLRALSGEQQTHREQWSYPDLWQQLCRSDGLDPRSVEFVGGSMADALSGAAGFVTVSSTAALEAIGLGVPILVLSDFGVSAETINEVFVGSGCLGTLDDLAAGRLHHPSTDWLQQNYFHPEDSSDWVARIEDLAWIRERGGLPRAAAPPVGGPIRRARRQLRLVLPAPALHAAENAVRGLRRTGGRILGRTPVAPAISGTGRPPSDRSPAGAPIDAEAEEQLDRPHSLGPSDRE